MQEQKLHVIFLAAWYPHRGDGMAGLFVQYHAQAVKAFADVSVLYVQAEEGLAQPEFVSSVEDGITVMRVYYPRASSRPVNLLRYLRMANLGYTRLIKATRPADVHHVHVLTRAGVLAYRRRFQTPYIITEHWSRYQPANRHQFKGRLHIDLTRRVIQGAYAVCPVNEQLAKAMQDMGFTHPRYRPIGNVVDMGRFRPPAVLPPAHALLHVSCFDEAAKNVRGLLRAFAEALKLQPQLRLVLVGDGPDWQACFDYAKTLGLADAVQFTGLLTGDALVAAYHQHRTLVLFSFYENQPVVILEALACNMLVIASDVGGIKDLLGEGRGVVVPPGDEAALTQAMVDSLLSLPNAASRSYIERHFSYRKIGADYYQLYVEALQSGS